MFKWRFRVKLIFLRSYFLPTVNICLLCLHCEVGVRPRIRVNYVSDYYGLTNLPDTTLIVTSRGLCTIKNSKNYVIFYTVNIDIGNINNAGKYEFYVRLRRGIAAVYLSGSSMTVGSSKQQFTSGNILRFMCY